MSDPTNRQGTLKGTDTRHFLLRFHSDTCYSVLQCKGSALTISLSSPYCFICFQSHLIIYHTAPAGREESGKDTSDASGERARAHGDAAQAKDQTELKPSEQCGLLTLTVRGRPCNQCDQPLIFPCVLAPTYVPTFAWLCCWHISEPLCARQPLLSGQYLTCLPAWHLA